MKVLIIGSGGREHAFVRQIAASPRVSQVFCAPGNDGMQDLCERVDIAVTEIEKLSAWARDNTIDLTVVGPERPLTLGVVDEFQRQGLAILGPTQKASQLEASKIFTKEFCQRHDIPTAPFRVFHNADEARHFLQEKNQFPIVLKADGLAAGKGVVVASSLEQALQAVQDILVDNQFQQTVPSLLVEDFLPGQEASFIVITDGTRYVQFPAAQDHKPVFDGDQGPNTGGMGAYAPAPLVTDSLRQEVCQKIIEPTLAGMRSEGCPYQGILYAGLMIDAQGRPSLLEYNCRFGDPEAQVLLPLLESDFVDLACDVVKNQLDPRSVIFSQKHAVTVVLAAQGYPKSLPKRACHYRTLANFRS